MDFDVLSNILIHCIYFVYLFFVFCTFSNPKHLIDLGLKRKSNQMSFEGLEAADSPVLAGTLPTGTDTFQTGRSSPTPHS